MTPRVVRRARRAWQSWQDVQPEPTPALEPIKLYGIASDPVPAPAKTITSNHALTSVVETWDEYIDRILFHFPHQEWTLRWADQAGVVGQGLTYADRANGLAADAVSQAVAFAARRELRLHMSIALFRHEKGATPPRYTLQEIELWAEELIGEMLTFGPLHVLSALEEQDNAIRRANYGMTPLEMAEVYAAIQTGALEAGYTGEFVGPATSPIDNVGYTFAEDLARAFEDIKLHGIGVHTYFRGFMNPRGDYTDGIQHLMDLFKVPTVCDQRHVPLNEGAEADKFAVYTAIEDIRLGNTGGWWPNRHGFNVGPLGDSPLFDVDGNPNPPTTYLTSFYDVVSSMGGEIVDNGPGSFSAGGETVIFNEDRADYFEFNQS